MSEIKLSGPERFLIALAVVADVITVLSFLGIHPDTQLRWIVVAILALLGVLSSGATLATSVIRWYSPKGSLYPEGYFLKTVLVSLTVMVISIVLGIFLVSQSLHTSQKKPQPRATHSTSLTKLIRGRMADRCLRLDGWAPVRPRADMREVERL